MAAHSGKYSPFRSPGSACGDQSVSPIYPTYWYGWSPMHSGLPSMHSGLPSMHPGWYPMHPEWHPMDPGWHPMDPYGRPQVNSYGQFVHSGDPPTMHASQWTVSPVVLTPVAASVSPVPVSPDAAPVQFGTKPPETARTVDHYRPHICSKACDPTATNHRCIWC